MKKPFRVGFRFCWMLAVFLFAYLDFVFRLWIFGKAASLPARAGWMQFWSRQFLRVLRAKVSWQGGPPTRGILVSNHLSYIDILVYGSIQPLVFLSKSEVRSWPVVGTLTRCAGTLYIQRQSKADVVRLSDDMVRVVNAGVPVTLFLEGTSTDGAEVLPFRSSLLAPVAAHGWPVCAAWIHYTLREGSVADEICYWRDMTFFSHLLNLLGKDGFEAFVSFDSPLERGLARKEMARELHARVCRLKNAHRP